MASHFKTIGVFGRVKNEGVKETLKTLIHFLKKMPQTIFVDAETADALMDPHLNVISREDLGKQCDLVVVVGGDGSLLHAAHAIFKFETPVIGINRGSLGFLTDIHPAELNKIKAILQGEYILEKRFLLSAQVDLNGKNLGQEAALNEIAIIPDAIPHMIEFEIYINQQFVCSQDSDGLIVATPTGSTAYALSGGGPILHPQLDAIVLVPMFSHSLNQRPIVIDANSEVDIFLSPKIGSSPRLSCDGRAYIPLPAGSHIRIFKNKHQLHLIHPVEYNYYEALRSKLHWSKQLNYSE